MPLTNSEVARLHDLITLAVLRLERAVKSHGIVEKYKLEGNLKAQVRELELARRNLYRLIRKLTP